MRLVGICLFNNAATRCVYSAKARALGFIPPTKDHRNRRVNVSGRDALALSIRSLEVAIT